MGIVDAGRLIYTFNTVSNAARQGARIAIVNQSTTGTSTCDTTVGDRVARGLRPRVGPRCSTCSPPTSIITYRDYLDAAACNPIQIGCIAVVKVTGTYQPLTPIIGQFIGTMDVSSTTKMPIERVCSNPTSPPALRTVEAQTPMNLRSRGDERGQILAIFAAGLIALLIGVGVVIDGGNAMAQQRDAQNGADAAAEAGTTVIAQYLMGGSSATGAAGTCPTTPAEPWDLEVCKAVYASAPANGLTVGTRNYIDWKGDPIPAGAGVDLVGDGPMPRGPRGSASMDRGRSTPTSRA